ncbi:transmembrane protein, putative [Medicago truncatula]|uniref:Transmembrane protein, putative n=1 Tax=Medicago truncatula TaxID=3880 RepID=G7KM74_MEDTR|nr:transmembrane protein, putative [Medicago truncatula]
MAYIFNLFSISLRFLILMIIAFALFVQLAPFVSADMKIRKLGNSPSPPPPPIQNEHQGHP